MTRGHAKHLRELIERTSAVLTDGEALNGVELFPRWDAGKNYALNERVQYGGKLYKCITPHTAQAAWTPADAPSLWAGVVLPGDGTRNNPIPYSGNMALEQGKYYTQNGVLYRCFRDTGISVYNALSDLAGIYVEAVS